MDDTKKADDLFRRMQDGGWVDHVSFRVYCSLLRRRGEIDKLISLVENLYSRYGNTDVEVCNAVLQYHCDNGDVVDAAKYLNEVFARLSAPNELSYTLMINAYCKSGDVDAANSLLFTMAERGCKAISTHYDLVIQGLCNHSRESEALHLFKDMNVRGIQSGSSACDRLLAVLSAGFLEEVIYLCNYTSLKEHHVTGLSLVSFMKCMSSSNRMAEAKVLLKAMMHSGCFLHSRSFKCCVAYLLEGEIAQVEKYFNKQTPNLVDYTMQIQAACRKGMPGVARTALSMMKERGLAPTYACYNKLIYGLSKCEDTAEESLELKRVIITKGLTIRKGSAKFLLRQDDESELKKLYCELKETSCLVEKVITYSTGELELNDEFYI